MAIDMRTVRNKLNELRDKYTNVGNFCFFTDISNLSAILNAGRLLNRNTVLKQGQLGCDCASQEVLQRTPVWVHDYVRLYFAPRTPMLYRVEGIKHRPDKYPECPRPFYLVFSEDILELKGCRVSDGNMGSHYTGCQELSTGYFLNLPFEGIFHRGALPVDLEMEAQLGFDIPKLQITRQRQAEVLIPNELPLQFLKALVFRSEAEKQMAMNFNNFPEHCSVEVKKDWFNCTNVFLDTSVA